jgi:hypothetical protein
MTSEQRKKRIFARRKIARKYRVILNLAGKSAKVEGTKGSANFSVAG